MANRDSVFAGIGCDRPVLGPGAQGVAGVTVDAAGVNLLVTFERPVSQSYLSNPGNYSLTGGRRLFPRIVSAQQEGSSAVRLALDVPGDFSVYTLTVSGPDIDPFFSSRTVRFRLSCDDRFDFRPPPPGPSGEPELPVTIDYLAKDYASFRQALLDFIPTRLPAWTERSEADLGIMLLELFASTADHLSYLQDRVAGEAFLATATQRRSLAAHLELIGYRMDEGSSAYTWLQFQVVERHSLNANSGITIRTQPAKEAEPATVFEVLGETILDPRFNEMPVYTRGNAHCVLHRTARSVALAGRYESLKAGDYLLFEDDWGNCDVVRLNDAPVVFSHPEEHTVVAWSEATPLHHDYCLSGAPSPGGTRVRGNIVVAVHGETILEEPLRELTPVQKAAVNAEMAVFKPGQRVPRQRLRLARAPLAYLDAEVPLAPRGGSTLTVKVDGETWHERASLLGSRPDEPVFRVEVSKDGEAAVVFGDGTFGKRPPETSRVTATYRVGGGKAGNIGARTLTQLHSALPAPWFRSVTNPLAATGGRDRESRDHARRTGPASSRLPLLAVSAADFEAAAQAFTAGGQQPVRRAKASFRWTGSWLTVILAVDARTPEGEITDRLRQELRAYLEARRVAGYDLEVTGAAYLSVDLALDFWVRPGVHPATVEHALRTALGAGDLPGGGKGFFHPDLFGFGENLYVSRIHAAAMAVAGVASIRIARLAPQNAARPDFETAASLRRGFLPAGSDQIVRLHNDRNFPEHGTLALRLMGVQK